MARGTHVTRVSEREACPRNRILAALPPDELGRLAPHLKTLSFRSRQILQKQGEPVAFVYFPTGGLCSTTIVLSSGTMVEAVTVGADGVIGFEASLGLDAVASGETVVQVPRGTFERLPAQAFREEIARQGTLARLVGRYVHLVFAQAMQLAACNAAHQVQERCCRWLLMTQDRLGPEFQLSQEFLAMMLGVRRQTVTLVARTLQQAGLIAYTRGHIAIVDRQGLEAAACECYAAIRRHAERLSPSDGGDRRGLA